MTDMAMEPKAVQRMARHWTITISYIAVVVTAIVALHIYDLTKG